MSKKKDFDSLSNEEQRILILKDVKNVILRNSSEYKIKKGTALEIDGVMCSTFIAVNKELTAKELLSSNYKCEACIRGALFLSKVKYNEDCVLDFGVYASDVSKSNIYLEQTFTRSELRYIEDIFELSGFNNNRAIYLPLFENFIKYYIKDEERVLLIVNFMLRNKGIFDFAKFMLYYPKSKLYRNAKSRKSL